MTQLVKHIEESKPSYIREILSVTANKEIISLAGGLPCSESFPMSIIDEVMPSLAQDKSLFQYANTAGHEPLREDLRSRYKVPDTHEILITSGSQQGIDLCARAFVGNGDNVVVENPSYLGALQIFSMAQANVLSVEHESDGPNLEQLEAHFSMKDIALFYAVPDFHNPTGCCWSLEKRQAVAKLCIKYQVLLLEDAPYRKMRFAGLERPTVSSLCPDNSIMLRSFSKMISPSLRVAAIITPKQWFPALSKLKQAVDLHTSSPMQQLALDILRHCEFEQHLANTNQRYKSRYQALTQELSLLPQDEYSFNAVEGGMFVWLNIPQCDTLALARSALDSGVAVVPGSEFLVSDQNDSSAIRLNFSHNKPDDIRQGIARLKPILESYHG